MKRREGCRDMEWRWLVPALFGIGSAALVLVFAIALGISSEAAGRAYQRIQLAQHWIAPASGWLLVAIGAWMCLHQKMEASGPNQT